MDYLYFIGSFYLLNIDLIYSLKNYILFIEKYFLMKLLLYKNLIKLTEENLNLYQACRVLSYLHLLNKKLLHIKDLNFMYLII